MKQMPWLSFFSAVARPVVGGDGAQLGLLKMADGEARVAELFLAEQGQEVGLVLVLVGALEQCSRRPAGSTRRA
jgi:hypothetical protein